LLYIFVLLISFLFFALLPIGAGTINKEEHFNKPWPVGHCLIAWCGIVFDIVSLFWNASLKNVLLCAARCTVSLTQVTRNIA